MSVAFAADPQVPKTRLRGARALRAGAGFSPQDSPSTSSRSGPQQDRTGSCRHEPESRVPPGLLEELASPRFTDLAPRFFMRKDQKIGVQGRPCDRIHLIAAGQVLLSRRDSEGQEHALYLLGPGEVFGAGALLRPGRWLVTARAVTDGSFHALPGAHVATLAQYYPQLAAHLFARLAARLDSAHRRLDLFARRSARDRLLGLLRTLACAHGETRDGEIWLPVRVTQGQLGSMIGLARETVVRTLSELQAEGIIRCEGREGYRLLRQACEGLAEGDL